MVGVSVVESLVGVSVVESLVGEPVVEMSDVIGTVVEMVDVDPPPSSPHPASITAKAPDNTTHCMRIFMSP